MLVEFLTLLALGYSCFSYASITGQRIDIWVDFVLKCGSILLQTIVVYVDMHRTFPMVVFEDTIYETSSGIIAAKWILGAFYILIMGSMLVSTIIFVRNIENELGSVFFQLIGFCLISFTLVNFLRDAYADCSGYAYCNFLDNRNNVKTKRAWLPCSLREKEMKIYQQEFYLIARRE
jgi:hypothetical protein